MEKKREKRLTLKLNTEEEQRKGCIPKVMKAGNEV